MGENNKYKRISRVSAIFMVATAVLCDLIELLLDFIGIGIIASYLVDIAAICIFSFWFILLGVDLSSPRAVARFWGTSIAELLPIPVLDFFLTTLGIVLMIKNTWQEDSGSQNIDALKTSGKTQKGMAGSRTTGKVPLVVKK